MTLNTPGKYSSLAYGSSMKIDNDQKLKKLSYPILPPQSQKKRRSYTHTQIMNQNNEKKGLWKTRMVK